MLTVDNGDKMGLELVHGCLGRVRRSFRDVSVSFDDVLVGLQKVFRGKQWEEGNNAKMKSSTCTRFWGKTPPVTDISRHSGLCQN